MSRLSDNKKTTLERLSFAIQLFFHRGSLLRSELSHSQSFACDIEGDCPNSSFVKRWFNDYLLGTESPFPYPLQLSLPPFYRATLEELGKIPIGITRSYQEVATRLGNPHRARAVGTACRKNPFPLIIPCHRVVQTGGKIGGFAYGSQMKQKLLEHESRATEQK